MFLNVTGGAAESEEWAAVTDELASAGLQSMIVLGPLLLKTIGKETAEKGGQSVVLPMPTLVKSTYGVMQKATRQAYEKLAAGDDDPEIVLGKGRDKPKFGHHSWREAGRHGGNGDARARRMHGDGYCRSALCMEAREVREYDAAALREPR